MSKWYIVRDGDQFGPYTARALRQYVAEGRLIADDLLTRPGLVKPVRAGRIRSLFPQPPTPEFARHNKSLARPALSPELRSDASTSEVRQHPLKHAEESAGDSPQNQGDDLDDAELDIPSQETWASALSATIACGMSSIRELLFHPIHYSFVTGVLFIACAICLPGIVTIILIPSLVTGYLQYLHKKLQREPASLGLFLQMLRGGWESLWHSFTLMGAFILASATMLAAFAMVSLLTYTTIGIFSLGSLQVFDLMSAPQDGEIVKDPLEMPPAPVPAWLEQNPESAIATVWGILVRVYVVVLSAWSISETGIRMLVSTTLFSASGSILILLVCIALQTTRTFPSSASRGPDCVIDAVDHSFKAARLYWKRFVVSGLWLISLPTVVASLTILAIGLAIHYRLEYLTLAIAVLLIPLEILGLVVAINLFSVKTASEIIDSITSDSG